MIRERLKTFIENSIVQYIILGIIFCNAILLGIDTIPNLPANVSVILQTLNSIITYIFIVEILIKLVAYSYTFFKDGWNVFDLIVVVGSSISSIGVLSSLRILRVLRIVRLTRVLTKLKRLQIIVQSIFQALPSIGWVALLMLVIHYIFALIGTTLFGQDFPEFFGNLARTEFTLFQVMSLEGWPDVAREIMEIYPFASFYFVSFIIVSSFLILNMVLGVVVNSIDEITASANKESAMQDLQNDSLQNELEKLKEQIGKIEMLIQKK